MTAATLTAHTLRDKPSLLDPVFERLRAQVEAGVLPVGALAVGDEEGRIRAEAFGRRGRPIATGSYFFLASVTKPLVATAFMQLVEAGLTGLHEPLANHIPELVGGDKTQITPWHVLTHTSGIADIEIELILRRRPTAAQMTQVVLESPLRFSPGTRWEYCSASFYLLALLIARLTGMPVARYLRERLFAPLGMATTFDPRGSGRAVVPVSGIGNPLVRWLLLRYMARATVPGGGLFGTLDDLTAFGAATLRPFVAGNTMLPLSAATIAEMGTDQTLGLPGLVDGQERPVYFGLGWGKPTLMRDAPGSPRVVAHGGATGTRLWLDSDAALVFVFFTNRWSRVRAPENEALAGTYRAMTDGA